MDLICLLSSRQQGKIGVQKYAEIECDSDKTYLVKLSKTALKVFIIRKWMTVIHILLDTESALWKDDTAFNFKS